jgi:polysaccharide transporter, PST family
LPGDAAKGWLSMPLHSISEVQNWWGNSLKTIVKNAGWLGLIQIFNYLIPFLTLPVVTRAFGPTVYGILATFNAYAAYVSVIVQYGFDFTGVRAIAHSNADIFRLSETVSTIFGAQILLGAVALAAFFVALPVIVPHGADYKLVGLSVLIQVFATAATPQWVFVGLEKMRSLALAQFVFRTLAAALIIFSIRAPGDLLLYVNINCIAAVAILIISLIVLGRYHIRWQIPKLLDLFLVIRQGAYFFVSKASISLYTTTTTLLVAIVLGPGAAGQFALADRIRTVAASIIGPLNMAIYPLLFRAAGRVETEEEARTQRIFFLGILALSALISIGLFVFAPLIIGLLAGNAFHDAILLLRIIAFLPFIITLSTKFGYQTMIPLHMDPEFMWIVISAALVGLTGLFILMKTLGLTGAALAVLAVEIYVTVVFAIAVQKRVSILSFFFRKS